MQLIARKQLNAWLVGGAVRNAALGIRTRDYDMIIRGNAHSFAVELSKELEGHFFSPGAQWEEYRIVLPRKRHIDVKQIDNIEQDLAERDFTMNAIAMDLSKGKDFLDPYSGFNAIHNRSIVPVSNNIFRDDPIRLLRLFRLGCALHFSPSNEALSLARNSVARITQAAGERIHTELMLLLEHQGSFQYIKEMDSVGLLAALFPEIEQGKQIPQHKYRSINLKDHSLVSYDIMEQIIDQRRYAVFSPHEKLFHRFVEKHTPLLKLAALLHDIGKLYSMRKDDDGKVHFWTHEQRGESKLREEYQHRFCFSKREVQLLSLLILHHMRAHLLSRETTITDHARYRFVKDGGAAVPGILLVTYADSIASSGGGKEVKRVERAIREIIAYYAAARKVKTRKRLITGHDLIERFGLPPGPIFGTLLDAVEQAQLNGKVRNKREAIAFVKDFLMASKQEKP